MQHTLFMIRMCLHAAKYQSQMTKHCMHTVRQNVLYCAKALVIPVVLNTPFQLSINLCRNFKRLGDWHSIS